MKLFAAALLALCAFQSQAALTVTVEAGDYERRETLVEFDLPEGTPAFNTLEAKGVAVPVQVEGSRAAFIVPSLKRGEKQTFTAGNAGLKAQAHATERNGNLILNVEGKEAFVYHLEKTEFPPNRPDLKPIFHRAGYIHPVLSPSGLPVTDDYPRNHKHHHGIWFSWSHAIFEGRTNDYWNMGEGKGTMEFAGVDRKWSGPVHAGFVAKHKHMDLTSGQPKAALNETWNVRLFAVGQNTARPYFLFDVDVKDECATWQPVLLPQYRYGGICVRGNWAWNGKTNAYVLTSEGETDRAKGDKGQVRANWVHLGGFVDGKFTGIAGFGHPSNFRSPEPIRLNAAEPYFNFTPQQAGDMEITPGKPFVGKYRFVVADGKPDKAELDRIWNDYAHPPVVKIGDGR